MLTYGKENFIDRPLRGRARVYLRAHPAARRVQLYHLQSHRQMGRRFFLRTVRTVVPQRGDHADSVQYGLARPGGGGTFYRARHGGRHRYLLQPQAYGKALAGGFADPRNQCRDRHRHFARSALFRRLTLPHVLFTAHRAYGALHALCGAFRPAQTQTDGFQHLRSGARPRRKPHAGTL